MEQGSRSSRLLGVALVGLAALGLVAGAFLPWWRGQGHGIDHGIGLRGVELCSGDGCTRAGLTSLGGSDDTWTMLGATSFAMGWVTVAFLVAALLLTVARPASIWRVRAARAGSAASLFALVVGAGFAWMFPGFPGMSWGAGLLCYLGGAAVAVGASGILLGRSTI